ncbi:MAG: MmgE/PrpD family protein [Chloroflexota bacterium]|nr:MmgE/PrpD family protein [Chloroflexota bacterium]MDE3100600.1 MmgE/PrpD family protein [Chloroflexota bacterium]
MSYTSDLAEYVSSVRYDVLPPPVVSAAKRITLDILGCMFAATAYRPGKVMTEHLRRSGDAPRATVVGTDVRVSPANAALANGTLASEMELDDVHEGGTHPSTVYVPALLAVAEDLGSSGTQWVAALTAAYDVGIRLSGATGMAAVYSRGFHPTSVCGTFGAAAGVAHLRGLDAAQVANAFGLTGSQASGMLTWEMEPEHFAKSFQSGVAARNAVTSVELAALGYIGGPDTLDGKYNIFDSFSTRRDFPAITRELGSRYEILYTGFKFYTCCRAIHAALDILLDLQAKHGFTAADVQGIDVALTASIAPMVDNNVLTTHNLQYILAAALVDGEVTRVQTSPERRADPVLGELASRVTLIHDPALEKRPTKIVGPTRLELRLLDGSVHGEEREDPRGGTALPVSDVEIEAKFRRLATPVIGTERADRVVDAAWRLETLPSMRELTDLLLVRAG